MVHLFHGDLQEASRRELDSVRQKFAGKEVVVLDGKILTLTDLIQATDSTSLFGSDRLVIVEKLFSKLKPKSSQLESIINFIRQIPASCEIIFWEDKELSKTIVSLIPKGTDIALFRPDRNVFAFVDSITTKNISESLHLFDETLKNDSPELIFTMLVRQLRYMIMIKDIGKNIPELSPWQASKFARQADHFSFSELIKLYEKLLDIDIRVKTSSGPFDLTQEIKLFLMTI